jgi:hypothetical protein
LAFEEEKLSRQAVVSKLIGPGLAVMKDAEDLDASKPHAVRDDVGGLGDNEFARFVDAAGMPEHWIP